VSSDQPIYLVMQPGDWLDQPGLFLVALPVFALLVVAWVRPSAGQAAVPVPGLEWLIPGAAHTGLQERTCIILRTLALLALIPIVAVPLHKAGDGKGETAASLAVVLDNSSSMTAADFQPFTRLDAAKRSLRSFLGRLPKGGVGLVALAGSPQTVAPITEDRRFVLAALGRIGSIAYEDDGTAIGSGVATAVNRLRGGSNGPRRVLLITDGVSNRGNVSPADAAEVARMMGTRVDAIGIGTDTISRFSVPTVEGVQQDVEARIEIDDRALDGLAKRTGGRYWRVRNVADLDRALAALEVTYGQPEHRDWKPDWRALLALAASGLVGMEVLFRHFVVREIPQ
jgi:Ca-activated chloride channel family protein